MNLLSNIVFLRRFLKENGSSSRSIYLLFISLGTGIADLICVVSLASLMSPLLNVEIASYVVSFLGKNQIAFKLALIFFLASSIRIYFNYVITYFGQNAEGDLSSILLEKTISKDIDYFGRYDTASFKREILSEVQQISNQLIYPIIRIFQASISALCLLGLMIYQAGNTSLYAISIIALSLFIVVRISGILSTKLGKKRFNANENRFKFLERILTSIRFIKVLELEAKTVDQYKKEMNSYVYAQVFLQILTQIPKFIFEILLVISLMFVISNPYINDSNIIDAVPTLMAALYRLIPTLQMIAQNFSRLGYGAPSLKAFHKRVESFESNNLSSSNEFLIKVNKNEIKFKTKSNIVIDIPKNFIEGDLLKLPNKGLFCIRGESGAGKTTFLDQLALLKNQESIEIKESYINKNNIFYMPQHLFLIEGTLMNNFEFFGINADQKQIKNAMNFSNIGHLFERLVLKEEIIGNSSEFSGLSGGEIKRVFLSIAYLSDKFVIMLDEPLTGIDKASRDIIAKSIKKLSLERPVFFVTHESPKDLNIEVDLDIFIQREVK